MFTKMVHTVDFVFDKVSNEKIEYDGDRCTITHTPDITYAPDAVEYHAVCGDQNSIIKLFNVRNRRMNSKARGGTFAFDASWKIVCKLNPTASSTYRNDGRLVVV